MPKWDELHKGKTVYGKNVGKVNRLGIHPDENPDSKKKALGNSNGLPDQEVLDKLIAAAQNLSLDDAQGKTMKFKWATAAVLNGDVAIGAKNDLVSLNHPSSICHEDNVFPIDLNGNLHLVIKQSMAPCIRCRAAFKEWAKQRTSAIIVSSVKGYDKAPDGSVFIFSPTGGVFIWH